MRTARNREVVVVHLGPWLARGFVPMQPAKLRNVYALAPQVVSVSKTFFDE